MQRLDWIDTARGLAILLVIVGHADGWLQTAPNVESGIRGIIYSFHMPLFFILSGLTLNLDRGWKELTSKSLRRLLLPALVVFAIRMAGKLYYWPADDLVRGVVKILLGAILGFGAGLKFAQYQLPMIGMCWFLVVLFLARLVVLLGAQRISSKYHFVSILALMSFGMYLGASHLSPISIDLVFVAAAFIWIGVLVKPILLGGSNRMMLEICLAVWIVSLVLLMQLTGSCFEMVYRRYPLALVSAGCAVAGSLTIIFLFKIVRCQALAWCGRHSMLIFCIHACDFVYVRPLVHFFPSVSRLVFMLIGAPLFAFLWLAISNWRQAR